MGEVPLIQPLEGEDTVENKDKNSQLDPKEQAMKEKQDRKDGKVGGKKKKKKKKMEKEDGTPMTA